MALYINLRSTLAALSLAIALVITSTPATAQKSSPYPGTKVFKTSYGYKTLVQRLDTAVARNKMGLVGRASVRTAAQ